MRTPEQKIEDYLIGFYLSDSPENAPFDEVLMLLDEKSDAVTVWEPFEEWNGGYLAEFMNEQKRGLMCLFEEMQS